MKSNDGLIESLRDDRRRISWHDDRVRLLAADRIEQLQRALAGLYSLCPEGHKNDKVGLWGEARAALEARDLPKPPANALRDFAKAFTQCFSKNGEYNSFSAEYGIEELHEMARAALKGGAS